MHPSLRRTPLLAALVALLALAAPASAAPSFAPGITNTVSFPYGPATQPSNGLTAADVRGNGRADVVTVPSGGYIGQMDALGAGRLGVPFPLSLPAPLYGATTADVNRDGHEDAIVNGGPAGPWLASGGPAGLGTPANIFTGYAGAPGIVADDLDGDGKADVAVQNTAGPPAGNPVLKFALGAGNGTFGTAQDVVIANGGASLPVNGLGAGDVNGDGRPDLVASSSAASKALVLALGNPASTGAPNLFLAPNIFDVGGTTGVDVAVGDVQGDARAEAVVATPADQLLVVTFTAAGVPDSATPIALPCAGLQVRLRDLDLDGRLDAVVRCADSVQVLPGTASGLGAPQAFDPQVTGSTALALGDVDGDGLPDIAVGSLTSVQVLLNTSPAGAVAEPGAVDFGGVTAGALSTARTVTLRATAGVVRPGGATASGPMLVTADGCTQRTLTRGQTCTVDVRFAPGAAGAASGTLTIPAAGGGTLATAALSGTGAAPFSTAPAAVPSLALAGRAQGLPGGIGLVLARVGAPGRLTATATARGAVKPKKRGKAKKAAAKRRPVTVASGAVTATTAGTWAIVLKPTKAGRGLLKRSLKTTLKVTYRPAGGGKALTRTSSLTLRR